MFTDLLERKEKRVNKLVKYFTLLDIRKLVRKHDVYICYDVN